MRVSTLQRTLGTGRAMAIGLASMIGAGVFFVWVPAAHAAGSSLLIGLVIAAVVAILNALSSAQLAIVHPVSGGTYAYARATVGPWTGFAAGWLFLAGKTASVGAIALIAGGYLWPDQARAVAIIAVVVLAVVNMTGIRSTATVSIAVVAVVLAGLIAVAVSALVAPPGGVALSARGGDLYGVLQSAGLLFFSFAGYARMATLGEEVRNPRRVLPRAIIGALSVTLMIYLGIGVLCIGLLGTDALADSSAPLADLVAATPWFSPVIRIVAGIACFGSLIGILAALSRTSLAMARERDLPGPLGFISNRTHAPVLAEAVFAILAIVGIMVLEPARLVGFSACAVLVYYSIAHLSAFRQPESERWLPRATQVVGFAGCLLLAVTLPWQAIIYAAGVLAVGLAVRALALRARAAR
ncbi:MAG TPA: amino acid permease [Terrimesophilobacter sp.]|nr:amino acid permease [Terrimesophilobacter sp.]